MKRAVSILALFTLAFLLCMKGIGDHPVEPMMEYDAPMRGVVIDRRQSITLRDMLGEIASRAGAGKEMPREIAWPSLRNFKVSDDAIELEISPMKREVRTKIFRGIDGVYEVTCEVPLPAGRSHLKLKDLKGRIVEASISGDRVAIYAYVKHELEYMNDGTKFLSIHGSEGVPLGFEMIYEDGDVRSLILGSGAQVVRLGFGLSAQARSRLESVSGIDVLPLNRN